MINLQKLLVTPVGRILLSIILGIGFACMFRTACTDKECIHFQGPVISEIDNKIFKHDEKCYIYVPVTTKCNAESKQIIDITSPIAIQ